jgi:hypothetical protein
MEQMPPDGFVPSLKRVQTNSNGFKYDSNDFKIVQISFDPNRIFPSLENLK